MKEFTCECCGKIAYKKTRDYNQSIRLGYKLYCSRKCQYSNHYKKATANPYRYLLSNARNRALYRESKMEFDITVEDIEKLWKEQNGKCYFSDIDLVLREGFKNHGENVYNQASIDRIDCSKGYIKGNIRLVCLMANLAKNNFSDEDFISLCKNVVLKHS